MADDDVIYISDDEQDESALNVTATPHKKPSSVRLGDSDSDSDVKEEDGVTTSTSTATITSSGSGKRKKAAVGMSSPPPERTRKRRSTGGSANASSANSRVAARIAKRDSALGPLKPLTPSTAVNSSMNASLVFDMVTSLSTNDPGAAIATLRSIVVLGKEYPSNLLYDELLERIRSAEAVAYADAVSIYASLVFVFDKAAACSCAVAFPHAWEPLAATLQDAATAPAHDAASADLWRRSLLVLQFYVYCLTQDLAACRARYAAAEPDAWVLRARVFALLQSSDASERRAKSRVRNNAILQAIGCALQLWRRVFDGDGCGSGASVASAVDAAQRRHEGEDACLAALRLVEMLALCTSQAENILQRIQAGVVELSRATRVKLAHALQAPDLKVRVATTVMGLTNKSRSKEFEWYESNAMGRVLQAISGASTDGVRMTDGYSWSHFDSFLTAPAQSDFGALLQEIAQLQQQQDA